MGADQLPVKAGYEVGHAKPPTEHRFQKGQSGWHWEQRMFDLINDAVSKRYKANLENRSFAEGASKEGATLEEFRKDRALRDEFLG